MAQDPVVALEIGTQKVVALVAEMREDGHVVVIGMGEQPSVGVRKGEVVDIENAVATVRSTIGLAEESADVNIGKVFATVSGGHIQSLVNRGNTPVLDADSEVGTATIEEVAEVASAAQLPRDCDKIHTVRQHYYLDGQEPVVKPQGMEARTLSLDMLIVYGVRSRINNTLKVLKEVPLDVEDVAFSGLCSALSVLSAEQKQGGVITIDLGAGTSGFVVYADNVMAVAGALGVGGEHITNDIALGMNIPLSQAERLKVEHGSAIVDVVDETQRVAIPAEGGFPSRSLGLKALQTIVHARADETLTIIRDRLGEMGLLRHVGAGVVLTGGSSRLRGIVELAERVFNLPCTVGKPRAISGLAAVMDGPEYATASGLVQFAFKVQGDSRKGQFPWWRRMLGRS